MSTPVAVPTGGLVDATTVPSDGTPGVVATPFPTPGTGRVESASGAAVAETPIACGSDASNPCWVFISQTDPVSSTLVPVVSRPYSAPAGVDASALFMGLALLYVLSSVVLRSAERILLGVTLIGSVFAVWLTGDIAGAELGAIVAVFLLCTRFWQWLILEFAAGRSSRGSA